MKGKLLSLFIYYILCIATANAQNIYKEWDNTIQAINAEGNSVRLAKQSNEILFLSVVSNSDSGYDKTQNLRDSVYRNDIWLLKIGSNGNIIWDKDYGNIYSYPVRMALLDANTLIFSSYQF
ncbi:MAG: hypothetical protein ABI772_10190, partial [Bacteroidota bacterium]